MSGQLTPRLRAALTQIVAYKPGKMAVAADGVACKLSSNESPYGPLPSVVEAIAAAGGQVNRYPDNGAVELVEAISARYRVPAEHVAVGCGSVGVTQQVLGAVAEPGAEVLYAWRSFEAYPILVGLSGATAVQVPLTTAESDPEAHDLDAMAAAVTPSTRLILVCNPNNPTGTVRRRAEIERFLDRVPEDCLVILDEAYREYVRDDAVADGLDLYRDRPNLAVLRTFSKAYGLAGLRVGFLVGPAPVAEAVRKTMLPFTVNHVAQVAAVASLAAEPELLARVDWTVAERTRVRDALLEQGWTVPVSQANFVWLRLSGDTVDFAGAAEHDGVSLRPFAGEGVRVTIGAPHENDRFLRVAAAYPKRN